MAEAIDDIWEEFRGCFERSRGPLDHSFWEDSAVRDELRKALRDPEIGREPEHAILWQCYSEIYPDPADRIEENDFRFAMQALWSAYVKKVLQNELLGKLYDRKLLHTLGEDVLFPHEIRRMIREYCRLKAEQCATKIFDTYGSRGIPPSFDEEERKEFCFYLQTPYNGSRLSGLKGLRRPPSRIVPT